jgi:hypothetical protein
LQACAMPYAIERFDSKPVSKIRLPARKPMNSPNEVNAPRTQMCGIARDI